MLLDECSQSIILSLNSSFQNTFLGTQSPWSKPWGAPQGILLPPYLKPSPLFFFNIKFPCFSRCVADITVTCLWKANLHLLSFCSLRIIFNVTFTTEPSCDPIDRKLFCPHDLLFHFVWTFLFMALGTCTLASWLLGYMCLISQTGPWAPWGRGPRLIWSPWSLVSSTISVTWYTLKREIMNEIVSERVDRYIYCSAILHT